GEVVLAEADDDVALAIGDDGVDEHLGDLHLLGEGGLGPWGRRRGVLGDSETGEESDGSGESGRKGSGAHRAIVDRTIEIASALRSSRAQRSALDAGQLTARFAGQREWKPPADAASRSACEGSKRSPTAEVKRSSSATRRPTSCWSAQRQRPPRKGGKPVPITIARSSSAALPTTSSARQRAASSTIRSTMRST